MTSEIPATRNSSAGWIESNLPDGWEDKTKLIGQFLARRMLILTVFLACFIPSAIVVFMLPKKYSAETVLLLDWRKNQALEGLSFLTATGDAMAVNSEVTMLQLPELADQVVEKLNLTSRAEYQYSRASGETGEKAEREARANAMLQFLQNLKVVNEPRTYTVRVRYTARDPVHAADVANTVAEVYIAKRREAAARATREASEWLNREIGGLQERVLKAETAERDYRQRHGLGDDRVASAAQQEVNALALQVTTASAELAEAQAKLKQASAGIVTSLQEGARVAADRAANTRRQLDEAKLRLDEVLAAEAGLKPLIRESVASRVLLEDLMRRARTADSQLEAPGTEVRVASRALVPVIPSSFGLRVLIPAAGVGSASIALAVAFLMIKLQGGFRSLDEAERRLGVPGIAEIPKVQGGARKARQLIVERPTSQLAEAIRSIGIHITESKTQCPVVLVTSPAPEEGKTVLAGSLAQALATANRRCLLIDADLRRPAAHRFLELPQQAGLCEVLAGSQRSEQVMMKVLPGPLTFMSAGQVVRDPLALLTARKLTAFFDSLKDRFEVIVIDSPPTLAVSDVTLLAPHASLVLMAIRWRTTTRVAASKAISILKRQACPRPFLVLTQVEHGKTSRYEEGRYGMDLSYRGRRWTIVQEKSPGAPPA